MEKSISSSTAKYFNSSSLTDSVGKLEEIEDTFSLGEVDMISENLKYILIIIVWYVLQIPTVTLGVITNILNIVIFRLSGLQNSMSIAFTALSISDLGYVTFFLIIRMASLLENVFKVQTKIHLSWLSYFLSFYAIYFQDVSVAITVFIAVQKCSCVAIPHLFKGVFTPRRTVAILVCLCVSMTCTYAPIFAGMTFASAEFPPGSNVTRVIVLRSQLFFEGFTFWRIFSKIVLPVSSQGICIVCLVIMVVHLRRSAKFRAMQTNAESQKEPSGPESKNPSSSAELGQKERRAVTAVALVLALFVVCTIPATLLSFAQLTAPLFFGNPRYRTLRRVLDNAQNILIHVSASVNIFIYLKYNTKFRDTAMNLFQRFVCSPEVHAKD